MIPVVEELNGFRQCSEEEWLSNVESAKDRATLELEIGTTYETIYFVKEKEDVE